ncbi:hypothetical protein V6N12_055614 [Hibiscus sabdariffa]|uniref:Uncharacterized protein n=1 Tax=Hibiscus sabdariffa TaxID=183260 RepID=A0ABR2BU80_9ROSI
MLYYQTFAVEYKKEKESRTLSLAMLVQLLLKKVTKCSGAGCCQDSTTDSEEMGVGYEVSRTRYVEQGAILVGEVNLAFIC